MTALGRRFWAFFLVLSILFTGTLFAGTVTPGFCEDDEDEDEEMDFGDDPGGFDHFDDLSGFEEAKANRECGDYTYQVTEDGEAAFVVNYHGSDTEIVVPEELDGFPVVAIGEGSFNDNDRITSVELPEGIVSIGNIAFFRCVSLETVILPEGVTLLDECCFAGCVKLKNIVIPSTVTEVRRFAFLNCISLEEVAFGEALESIGPGAFQLCASLAKAVYPESALVEADAFAGCSAELEITNT